MSVIGPGMAAWAGSAAMEGAQHAFTISDTPNEKTYHTMKPMISTRIAATAFTSLHASDRNEYHNSLLAKAGVKHPPLTRSRRPVATNTTRLFSPACRTHSGPKPAVKSAKLAEPSADAIYNAYPNQGPGFYRYVERNSSRRNYYLGRSRRIAAK